MSGPDGPVTLRLAFCLDSWKISGLSSAAPQTRAQESQLRGFLESGTVGRAPLLLLTQRVPFISPGNETEVKINISKVVVYDVLLNCYPFFSFLNSKTEY